MHEGYFTPYNQCGKTVSILVVQGGARPQPNRDQNPEHQLEGVELDKVFTGEDSPMAEFLCWGKVVKYYRNGVFSLPFKWNWKYRTKKHRWDMRKTDEFTRWPIATNTKIKPS